jgi:hypothetical protein
MGSGAAPDRVFAQPPERVLVRLRSSQTTLSAWRMQVISDEGPGAITLLEPSPNEIYYRGEGAFLGWSQEQLAALYRSLTPTGHPDDIDTPQLG